jgi:hypothetical protein
MKLLGMKIMIRIDNVHQQSTVNNQLFVTVKYATDVTESSLVIPFTLPKVLYIHQVLLSFYNLQHYTSDSLLAGFGVNRFTACWIVHSSFCTRPIPYTANKKSRSHKFKSQS